MSTLQQLKSGLHQAWDTLAQGWEQLRGRAAQALTRFHPPRQNGELQTADERLILDASRWAVLAAEIRETDSDIEVSLEAPGMTAEDFDIQMVDDHLVIRGEKHLERSRRDGHYHVMECAYGRFERALPLPTPVDEAGARARYKRGVLHVSLPKSRAAVRRRVEVTSE